jgi:ferrous iron transport protein B
MRFVLVGQPNCGKSTLFNQVAGYKAETGNFSGTTITYTESKVRVLGEVVSIVDLPGTYSLAGTNPAEREVLRFLLRHPVDAIINVLDASHLSQGLNLTLELLELGLPVVVATNMMDEAARLSLKVDGLKLQEMLGVQVLPLVARKSQGVRNLFTAAMAAAQAHSVPERRRYSEDVEQWIQKLAASLNGQISGLNPEPIAIKLIEGDAEVRAIAQELSPGILHQVARVQQEIALERGQPGVWVLNSERHALANEIARQVLIQGERRISKRDQADDVLLHPFWGYFALVFILWLFFQAVYGLGSVLEGPLLAFFDLLQLRLVAILGGSESFGAQLVIGVVQGIAGGVAIVLPYLIPFLFGLGLLEDVGYLPRLAFMMDALMNRIGLHGKAIVPFILGYGCNVPAVMSTRMMEDRRDRFLAASLATLVPCAARLAVVFGLVAFYLGPQLALAIYLFNLVVIAVTGRLLSHLLKEESLGLILEMPVYRLPTLKAVFNKTWFRAREFIVEAWPLLIVGSVVLSVLNWFDVARWVNALTLPITWALGLPAEVGAPLLFGIMRKELSLVMLRQALGVADLAAALTPAQMVTYTIFVVFYVPCLATLIVLRRELGNRDMFTIAALTVAIALLAALAARLLAVFAFGNLGAF